jgi:hypothetical protein
MLAKTESSGMIATRSKSISSIDDVAISQSSAHIRSLRCTGTHARAHRTKRKKRKRLLCNSLRNNKKM